MTNTHARARSVQLPAWHPLLHLTAAEGGAIAVLDALLGVGGLRERPAVELPAGSVRHELMLAGAERMRVACMRFLVESGGWRQRYVIRNGKRVEGRIFDPAFVDDFYLRFSQSTDHFWPEVARVVYELRAPPDLRALAKGGETKSTRKQKRLLRDLFPSSTIGDTGDWLFFTLARRHMGALRLEPEDTVALGKRLVQASPLATLIYIDDSADDSVLDAKFERLFEPSTVSIVESVGDRLVENWCSNFEGTWQARHQLPQYIARCQALSRTIRSFIRVADKAKRLDIVLPVAQFAAHIATKLLPPAEALRASITALSVVPNIEQRNTAIAATAEIVGLGTEMLRLRNNLALERYGEDRYEEAQIFVLVFDRIASAHVNRFEALTRALSDTLGLSRSKKSTVAWRQIGEFTCRHFDYPHSLLKHKNRIRTRR